MPLTSYFIFYYLWKTPKQNTNRSTHSSIASISRSFITSFSGHFTSKNLCIYMKCHKTTHMMQKRLETYRLLIIRTYPAITYLLPLSDKPNISINRIDCRWDSVIKTLLHTKSKTLKFVLPYTLSTQILKSINNSP